jgi:hypothetical protein
MSKREVSAKEILDDVHSGLGEEALMAKHQLSPKQVRKVLTELAKAGLLELAGDRHVPRVPRRISAAQMAGDIRAGMTGFQLMAKYELSCNGLQVALDKLLQAKVLLASELPGELSLRRSADSPEEVRTMGRSYLDFDLPIIEKGPVEIEGRVRDITEKGLGVIGIPGQVGEVKTFLIRHDNFVLINPFLFQAECRWIKEGDPQGKSLAGFLVTEILPEDLEELRKLVRIVTLCE